jgi:hypothetical protein
MSDFVIFSAFPQIYFTVGAVYGASAEHIVFFYRTPLSHASAVVYTRKIHTFIESALAYALHAYGNGYFTYLHAPVKGVCAYMTHICPVGNNASRASMDKRAAFLFDNAISG